MTTPKTAEVHHGAQRTNRRGATGFRGLLISAVQCTPTTTSFVRIWNDVTDSGPRLIAMQRSSADVIAADRYACDRYPENLMTLSFHDSLPV